MALQIFTATPGKIRITELLDPRFAQKPSVAEASEEGNGYWILNNIWVPENRRCKGVGSAILDRMIVEIEKQGGRMVSVDPGAEGSDLNRLISFYYKHGFDMCEDGSMRRWTANKQRR